MVESALAWWLRYGSLTGLQAVRKSNLLTWRQYIGHRIWVGRLPANTGAYGCTLTRIATQRDYGTGKENGFAFATTQVDIFGRRDDAAEKVGDLADALRLAITLYNGTWNDVEVGSVLVSRESHLVEPPVDNSPYWQHRYSMDFRIEFAQTGVNEGP